MLLPPDRGPVKRSGTKTSSMVKSVLCVARRPTASHVSRKVTRSGRISATRMSGRPSGSGGALDHEAREHPVRSERAAGQRPLIR